MRTTVTYACIDCGKERTAVLADFKKPREEYRCRKCAAIIRGKKYVSTFSLLNKDKQFQELRKTALNTTDYRNKIGEISRARWADPLHRTAREERKLKKKTEKMFDPLNMPRPKPKMGSEEYREQKRQIQKILVQDPVYIKKISEGVLKKHKDKEWSEQQRKRTRLQSQTLEWKQKNSDGQKKSQKTKEHCKRMAEIKSNKLKTDETFRDKISRKQSEKNLQMWQDPEYIKKFKESRTGQKRTEISRARILEGQLGGFWYGNVRYPPKYCEVWKEVNPRVHAFFDYKCVLCGEPENGHSHIGHHVFYVKEACCWYSDEGIYYTNLNARKHPEKDYCIGENPNYFVILCNECHGKTNGGFERRKYYADMFRQMIDTYYGGKCYLSKEEYAQIRG